MSNEQTIWQYCKNKGLNDFGTAGLMGNLYAESGLNPQNLQNTYERSLGISDALYTKSVDNGTYTNFVRDSAGYGLAQWTYWSRKQNLLNFAKQQGKSIGDLNMQLDFLFQELTTSYSAVLKILKNATSIRQASDAVLLNFERPANQGESVQIKRAAYGQTIYENNKGGVMNMTELQLRQKVADIAKSFIGCKESDGSHKKIIDLYNSHTPLAVGYKVTYTDAWCDTFVSAVAIQAGLTDIIPTECGCDRHIALFQKLGCWVENDAYGADVGDLIFYDWDDNGVGDNTGSSDHVGIVVATTDTTLTVIEGNKNNAVEYRTIPINGRYIRGFGVPNYASKATVQTPTVSSAAAVATTGFTNSPLVSYTKISPNKTVNRTHAIDTITIHCVVGQCSVERLGDIFAPASKKASSNYGVGYDGKIGMYVEEKDRSWCTSSSANDNRAITIEVASDTTHPYAIKDAALQGLIKLVADICQRNNIKELKWKADKNLIGQVDKQNMTAHRWFAAKACPGDYLYNLFPHIAEEVNKILNEEDDEDMTQEKFNEMMNTWMETQAARTDVWQFQEAKDMRTWAEGNEFIKGDEKGRKMYKKPMTREENLVVLYRILSKAGLIK